MYRAFVGEAMGLFKPGRVYEEVFAALWSRYAAEFGEGYDEMEGFVHADVGPEIKKIYKQPARLMINKRRMFVSISIGDKQTGSVDCIPVPDYACADYDGPG